MHLADAFIQSDLQLHSGYTFFLLVHVFPGNRTTTFRSADAMFYHWATQEHIVAMRARCGPDLGQHRLLSGLV